MHILPIERVQAIFDCFDGDCSVRETTRRTGAAQRTVARYKHAWRRSRIRGADVEESGETLAVRPSQPALRHLAAAAAARGVSRGELIAELLEAIVDDNLVDFLVGGAAP